MITANFRAYNTYVTDSVYQWDLNQVLEVAGLNLTAAPEVHFSNANMDRAIVRQATLTDQVVRVEIPNSLLQDPQRIRAHIGIYEGSTFKVVELVEIPVIARKRPQDYQIEAADGEVYSFKALENALANAATKAQVANLVANAGSDSELVDVRYGADGETYASAGEAVRAQGVYGQYIGGKVGALESVLRGDSINYYDPALQTESTISPHYFVHGEPHTSTQFDNTYHCTAPIPVDPLTVYTVGLVPGGKPWGEATSGVFFYDAAGTFISETAAATFMTPYNAVALRFNYNQNIASLAGMNSRCMLVKGSELPGTFTPYRYAPIEQRLSALEQGQAAASASTGAQYFIDGDVLRVAYPYNATHDLLVELRKKGSNRLFDFYRFALFPAGQSITAPTDVVDLQTTSTDWHAPFIVGAVENIDGDTPDEQKFTGGSHDFNNTDGGGAATARTTVLQFFADGRELTAGSGRASVIEARWTNLVQGYNTEKADGTGREILAESHVLTFKDMEFSTYVELTPLEDVVMRRWYGLQACIPSELYDTLRYVGGTDRTEHPTDAQSACGDNKTTRGVFYGGEHRLEMELDPTLDLGARTMYSGRSGLFCETYGKAYFFIIEEKELARGALYALRGKYVFRPA